MKRHKWLVLLMIGTLAVLALSACVTEEAPVEEAAPAEEEVEEEAPPAEEEEEEAPPEEAAPRKVAIFTWVQEFDSLNPLYTNMWFSSITQDIWDCRGWNFDDENNPVPVLVTEIPSLENGGISEDNLVITMTLRDDIVWSDNTPITSADFVFTYEMAIDPNNTVASQYPYDQITSVEAPDERTVVVMFDEPFSPWLTSLYTNTSSLLPEHILRPVYDAEGTIDNAEWNRAPTVGCGPFVFVEWESGSYARFVANENYWLGRPSIDELFFQFVPDYESQTAALVAGDADLGTFFDYSDVPTLEGAGVTVIPVQSGYNEGLYFYMGEDGHPALQDVNVRQAFAYATDRATLVTDLLLGLTEPAATDWHNTPYQDPSIVPYTYDPDEAIRLLEASGWTDTDGNNIRDNGEGLELSFTYGTTTREVRQETQAVLQQELAAVGIHVELLSYDSDIFFNSYGEGGPAASGELDVFEYSNSPFWPDPDAAEWLCSELPSDEYPDGGNWSGICDQTLNDLFEQQQTTVDPAAREAIFHEITLYLYDQAYWVGLWYDPDLWGISNRLQNVRISGATPFFNVVEWDITE